MHREMRKNLEGGNGGPDRIWKSETQEKTKRRMDRETVGTAGPQPKKNILRVEGRAIARKKAEDSMTGMISCRPAQKVRRLPGLTARDGQCRAFSALRDWRCAHTRPSRAGLISAALSALQTAHSICPAASGRALGTVCAFSAPNGAQHPFACTEEGRRQIDRDEQDRGDRGKIGFVSSVRERQWFISFAHGFSWL